MTQTAGGGRAFEAIALISIATAVLYAVVVKTQQAIAFGAPSVAAISMYVAAMGCLFSLYIAVVRLASNNPLERRGTRAVACLAPIAIQAALIGTPPTLSIDVLTYLAHGRQVQLGRNPYAEPVKDVEHTAYGEALVERGWLPVHGVSPYGPVWTWIESATARASSRLDVQLKVAKAVTVLFALACAWLIWRLLGRVAPESQMRGTLLYLWNPVVIMEFAADGHNDAVALAGVLAALLFTVSARPAASLLALGWSGLVKITSVITLPPQAIYWWRCNGRRSAPSLTLAAAMLGAATALLYAPFWIGRGTLDGIWGHGRLSVQPSTPGVLLWGLDRLYSAEAAAPVLAIALSVGFAAFALGTSLRVTDERSTLRACGRIAVAYLLLAPGYWPWYAVLPIALLALSPSSWSTTAIVLFSVGSRLAAPVERLRLNGLMDWPTAVILSTALGLWLPAAALAMMTAKRRTASSQPGVLSSTLGRIGIGRRRLMRRLPS